MCEWWREKREGKRKRPVRGVLLADYSGFFEGLKRSVFLDVAETLYRYVYQNRLASFRNENTALLEVCLSADLSGWVELRSTRPV